MNEPLAPTEAVALFRSGTPLAFLAEPYDAFVMGRWMSEPVLAVAVPPDLEAFFTNNPVIVYGTYVPPPPGVAVSAIFRIKSAGWSVRGNNMAVELPNGKVVDLTVAYEDSAGEHAPPPGPINWSSSDEEIATVEAKDDPADGTVAVVTSVAEGSATITASSGSITATLEIDVSAEGGGDAVAANITAGEPYDSGEVSQGLPARGALGARPGQPPQAGAQPVRPGPGQRPGQLPVRPPMPGQRPGQLPQPPRPAAPRPR